MRRAACRCISSCSARCAKPSSGASLGPDDALPAERDLATDCVSRITVRKAIDGLVEEGLLVRRQGSGTFVCARVEKNFSKLTSFSEDMRARGRTPRSVWLKRSAGTVTPEEALTLRSSPGTPVYRFHRIRFADDAPMALEYATVLASCLPSLEAVETSLYEALERTGNRPVRALQRLRAVLLTAEQAELLGAKESDAGLLVERVGFHKDGRAVEFSQSYYRGDTYDFVAELSASDVIMPDRTRMFREAAEAPRVVRAQLERNRAAACEQLGDALRAAGAARGRDLRARQLGSCGHVREIPDRDARRRADVLRRAVGQLGLRGAARISRACVFLAISQSGASPDLVATRGSREGGGRAASSRS